MNVIEAPSNNLQLMPMEKGFTGWHLNDKTSQTVTSNSPSRSIEAPAVCITVLKAVKDTGGYFHGGLND